MLPPNRARSAVDSKATLVPSSLNDGFKLIDSSAVLVRRRRVELDSLWRGECIAERRTKNEMTTKALLRRSMMRLLPFLGAGGLGYSIQPIDAGECV